MQERSLRPRLYLHQRILWLGLLTLASISLPLHAAPAKSTPRQFFQRILPLATKVNQHIRTQRGRVKTLYKQWKQRKPLTESDQKWLQEEAARYDIATFTSTSPQAWKKLLRRMDTVPLSMILAQAAHESAYGRSRFAREGNSLFGQWCFSSGCGIVPKARPEGRRYEVQRFPTYEASIAAYVHNLNTQRSYREFRQLRAAERNEDEGLCGSKLSPGLRHYAPGREKYVTAIQRMIRHYKLERYDDCSS